MPTETRLEEEKKDCISRPDGELSIGGGTIRQPASMAINMTNPASSPSNNRPPSASSVHSGGSGAANGPPPPRTTAMSRRGGRTRSRSPSSMTMNRPPSTTPSEGSQQTQQQQHMSQTSTGSAGPSGASNPPPMSPANPSAAAAAAAAAAKSLNRHGPGQTTPVSQAGGNHSSSGHYPQSSFYGGGPHPDDRGHGSGYGRPPSHSLYSGNHSRYGGPPAPPHLRAAPGYYDPHGYSHAGLPPHHHAQHPHRSNGAWPPSDIRNGPPGASTSSPSPKAPPPGSIASRRDDPYGYNPYGSRRGGGPPPPPGGGSSRGDPYHHHRYGGGPDDSGEYSRRGPPPPSQYSGRSNNTSLHYPPYSHGGPPPSSTGGAPRTPNSRNNDISPHPPSSNHRRGHGATPDPYGYAGGSSTINAKEGNSAHASKDDSGMKSTKGVIGTATPIHVPRASEAPPIHPASAGSRQGSARSVFRGRPGSDMNTNSSSSRKSSPGMGDTEDGDSNQQKILMAFGTPSHSFEEKKTCRADDANSSPEDPPQLRNNADQSLFFEPQRSPRGVGPPQPTNSLDMAPSFSLFNQSFDSLGDTAHFFNVGGPLDSGLQSTSFGGTSSILEEKGGLGMGDLQLTASNGTFKLNPSGSGGNLTFGMSPTNSFGIGPISSFSTRGGNITLLGNDHRAASPSQVLELGFRSGSGTSPRAKPLSSMEEGSLRLSASIGSPTYARPFIQDPGPSPSHYQQPPANQYLGHPYQGPSFSSHRPYRGSTVPAPDGAPHFYIFLRRHKEAFRQVTFLLPGLKKVMNDTDDQKQLPSLGDTPKRQGHDRRPSSEQPNQEEIEIARRRISSAICAFGGTFIGSRMNNPENEAKTSAQLIFREKSGGSSSGGADSSSGTSLHSAPKVSKERAKYDDALPGRYYENDNRLSWEFEENPPIGDFDKDDDDDLDGNGKKKKGGSSKNGDGSKKRRTGSNDEDDDDEGSVEENEDGSKDDKDGKSDQPKMRYRCKLCGQPKQNHNCPYQQSLARSIGIMVYPAVNAFTSAEPGVLAPALTDMNNFIGSGADSVSSGEGSPSRPTPDRLRRLNASGSMVGTISTTTAQVTPESLRGTPRGVVTSPAGYDTPKRKMSSTAHASSSRRSGGDNAISSSSSLRKKRPHGQVGSSGGVGAEVGTHDDLLFVEAMDLKPEQFRMVTYSKSQNHPDAFTYPSLPLPYAQRKRLSDNLFSLSKEVPQLTDECASVLREARERDLWDLAVAELMTQVVVVVHCHDGDMCFEGLRHYLLTLGISC